MAAPGCTARAESAVLPEVAHGRSGPGEQPAALLASLRVRGWTDTNTPISIDTEGSALSSRVAEVAVRPLLEDEEGESQTRTHSREMAAMGGGHATMADVTTAMARARQFIEHRRAAVDEDVGEFGFSAVTSAAAVAHRMAAHAHAHHAPMREPQPEPAAPTDARARFLAAGGGGGGSIFTARAPDAQGSPEEYRSPSTAYSSAGAISDRVYTPSAVSSYSGTPGTPGGLAARSRQLRAMRGAAAGGRSPGQSVVGSAYGAQSFASFAPSTPGDGSPTGDLRSRAQRLREAKSGSASWVPPPDSGTPVAPQSPYRFGSTAGGSVVSASGFRAASPWRGASPSRFTADNVAESQSVRMRAYNLLQQKKGPGAAASAIARNQSATAAGARPFSPARQEARSPAFQARSVRSVTPEVAREELFKTSPPRANASVGVKDSLAMVHPAPAQAQERLMARHAAPGMDRETEKIVTDLRAFFKTKRIDLHDAFSQFDADGNHEIDAEEFRQGLRKMDLGLTEQQISALMRAMDVDGDGRIDYFEFAKQYGIQRGQAAKQLLSRKAADRAAAAKERSAARTPSRRGKEDTEAFLNKLRTISSQTPEPRSRDTDRARSPARDRGRVPTKSPETATGSRRDPPATDNQDPSTPPPATAAGSSTGTERRTGRKSMAEKAALLAAAREEVKGSRRPATSPAPSTSASTSRADALLERSRAQRAKTAPGDRTQTPDRAGAASDRNKTPDRPRSKSVLKERAQKMQEARQKKGGSRKK